MKQHTLALAFLALTLSACGGSDSDDDATTPDNALLPSPSIPSNAEQNAFNASKVQSDRYEVIYGAPALQDILVNGQRIYSNDIDSQSYIATRDARSLPQGFADYNGAVVYRNSGARGDALVRSYQGFRSGSLLIHNLNNGDYFATAYGYETPLASIPDSGQATYRGYAMDRYDRGNLTYNVDFGNRTGSGHISGLSRHGYISLHPATYRMQYDSLNNKTDYNNRGSATAANGSTFTYTSSFYGAQAEELAGTAINNSGDAIIFHGTRGAVTP